MQIHKLIILGTGPAGYTAALYAARANLEPLLISGYDKGGQLMTTTDVDNWPGGLVGLQGPQLMADMETQVQHFGVVPVFDQIAKVDVKAQPIVLESVDGLTKYYTHSLIIATGASAKYLGLESESFYRNRGVSACATCDGFFFKDQTVAVIGGGNTAVEEALYLSKIAKKVYLIHRRSELRAEKIMVNKLLALAEQHPDKLEIIWNHQVAEVLGDGKMVTGLSLAQTTTGALQEIAVQGVFVAIGHTPNTSMFVGQLDFKEQGYLQLYPEAHGMLTRTSVAGVFAAGDVADPIYRQAITSAGSGCMAALDAEKYLASLDLV